MALTFKTVAIALVVFGLLLGVVFGLGVAYGHGKPKAAAGGLTTQQLQQLVGANSFGGGGAGGAGGAAGAGGNSGGAGAAGAATANGATGRITAVQGQTVTIQTAQGTSVKINLGPTTTVSKSVSGTTGDLTAGTMIYAAGTRKDDGSYDATSVAQVPPELQSILGGGGTRPATGATPATTPTGR